MIYLIVGPTGIGKTRRAVQLAGAFRAPVVSLDRVQCCRDLSVGSGRPSGTELAGTVRIYLGEGRAADGIVSAAEAADRLEILIGSRAAERGSNGRVDWILEGGSISLLSEISERSVWRRGHSVRLEYLSRLDMQDHRQRLHSRVRCMLDAGGRTLLDELAELWPDERTHAVLQSVLGYREAIAFCAAESIDPSALPRAITPDCVQRLCELISDAHLSYSELQTLAFARVIPSLRSTAVAALSEATS